MTDLHPDDPYDIGISFAGSDRPTGLYLANRLQKMGFKVFFDEFEQGALWGSNVHDRLGAVFGNGTRGVIVLLSQDYLTRVWPRLEHAAIRNGKARRVWVLRVDGSLVEFDFPVSGYFGDMNELVDAVARGMNLY